MSSDPKQSAVHALTAAQAVVNASGKRQESGRPLAVIGKVASEDEAQRIVDLLGSAGIPSAATFDPTGNEYISPDQRPHTTIVTPQSFGEAARALLANHGITVEE